jgi:hypothetical protein
MRPVISVIKKKKLLIFLQVIHEDPENSAEAEPETNSVPG